MTKDIKDRIDAYVIVKEYDNNGDVELDLVDFVADEHTKWDEIFTEIAIFAYNFRYKRINAWVPIGHPAYNSAEKLGFVPKSPFTYFCI